MENNYFGIPNQAKLNIPDYCEIPCEKVLDGADVIYELLPVSKRTGHRSSTLSLLKLTLSPKYQHLIPQILQELPTINSDRSLTDEQRCETLAFRLCSGTPAEEEIFAKEMLSVYDSLTPAQQQVVESEQSSDEPGVVVEPEAE